MSTELNIYPVFLKGKLISGISTEWSFGTYPVNILYPIDLDLKTGTIRGKLYIEKYNDIGNFIRESGIGTENFNINVNQGPEFYESHFCKYNIIEIFDDREYKFYKVHLKRFKDSVHIFTFYAIAKIADLETLKKKADKF